MGLHYYMNKGPQTNLTTSDLFPVAMTFFRSVASPILEPCTHEHLFKTNHCCSFVPEKETTEG